MTSELPPIELEDNGTKGRYVLRGPDGAEAEMTFTKIGESKIIIDHTGVPDAFRGQGAGLRLVTRAVEDARAGGKRSSRSARSQPRSSSATRNGRTY